MYSLDELSNMDERELLKHQLLNSTYKFGKGVLGFDLFTDVHEDLSQFLDNNQRSYRGQTLFKMILMSRGTFKSSLGVLSYAARRLCENPDLRILIYSAEFGLSERSLKFIKNSFETNKILKGMFGDHQGEETWTNRAIVTSQRTKVQRDPSISCGGTNAQLTGDHYDLIICDDIYGNKNTENIEQIKRVKEQFAALMPLLDRHNGGEIVVIGTIWHHNDLYMDKLTCSSCGHKEVNLRGVLPKNCLECGTEREWDIMYMPAWDGDLDDEHDLNFPTILNDDILGQIRKEMYDATGSEYSFSCNPGEAPILMSDWSMKPIKDVRVGDEVMGFSIGTTKGGRSELVPTVVEEINSRLADVQRVVFDDGEEIRCTPDHQWYTGRHRGGTHKIYMPSSTSRDMLRVCDTLPEISIDEQIAWSYLAGIIDGEGACKHVSIQICQCQETNPEVYQKIIDTIEFLGIEYSLWTDKRETKHRPVVITLKGARDLNIKLIHYGKPAKAAQLLRKMAKSMGRPCRDRKRPVDLIPDGEDRVYALKTGTGNYVAWGFMSKNCQYALRPIADEERIFQRENFRYFSANSTGTYGLPSGVRYSITMDPAAGKKRHSSNTAINISAFTPHGQWYLVHSEQGKWSEDERIQKAVDWLRRTGCRDFGIEVTGSANLAEIFEREFMRERVHVKVHKIQHGNRPKAERVASLARFYNRGDIFHPKLDTGNVGQGIRVYEANLLGCSRTIVPDGSDDVDAMAMQLQMPACHNFQTVSVAQEYKATHRLDQLERRRKQNKRPDAPSHWMEC